MFMPSPPVPQVSTRRSALNGHRSCQLTHHARCPDDLVDGLALHAHTHEEGTDLRIGALAGHDLAHYVLHFGRGQVEVVDHPVEGFLDIHARTPPCCLRKLANSSWTLLGQDGLGVELHALDIQGLVAQAHDLVHRAVLELGPGSHFQAVRQRLALDHQRVVAGHGQRLVEAGEHALVLVENRTGLAVHHLTGAHHVAAEGLTNALVTQAHAEDRQLAGKVQDGLDGHTRLGRRAGAGRNHDALRLERFDLSDGQLIVADHMDIGTQLAQVLHHVVGKGVVVIDHQQHVGVSLTAQTVRRGSPRGTWRDACSGFLPTPARAASRPQCRRQPAHAARRP